MTKKDFKELCDFHTYTEWNGKQTRINAIYVEHRATDEGSGFKYAVASDVENCTKAELLNIAYDFVVNEKPVPYYVFSRYASTDAQRFKVPLSFNYQNWN